MPAALADGAAPLPPRPARPWPQFLGAVMGGATFQQIGNLVGTPGYWMQILGAALPAASTFFLNYCIVAALSSNFSRFVWWAGARVGRCWGEGAVLHCGQIPHSLQPPMLLRLLATATLQPCALPALQAACRGVPERHFHRHPAPRP